MNSVLKQKINWSCRIAGLQQAKPCQHTPERWQ